MREERLDDLQFSGHCGVMQHGKTGTVHRVGIRAFLQDYPNYKRVRELEFMLESVAGLLATYKPKLEIHPLIQMSRAPVLVSSSVTEAVSPSPSTPSAGRGATR